MLNCYNFFGVRRFVQAKLIVTLGTVLLVGCQKNSQEAQPAQNVEPTKSTQSQELKVEAEPVGFAVEKERSVMINGSKFRTKAETLRAGARVMDLQLQQQAEIKGTLVVVVNDELPASLTQNYRYSQLADGVYELTPRETGLDVQLLAKQLTSMAEVETVEIQLRYLGDNPPPIE